MPLIDYLPQCCDAKHYLVIGEACAQGGDCYDILRPMGAVYWFSIPGRLGLRAESLIYLHLLLMGLSIVLSLMAIRSFLLRNDIHLNTRGVLLAGIYSALVHGIFFYPVLFHSLSDAPSAALFLIACWLCFFRPATLRSHSVLLVVIALLFGLSAWIRSFFLYPLLASLLIWFVLQWKFHRFRPTQLLLLIALTPIALQYGATWQRSQQFSYIHPSESAIHHEAVLIEPASGYDTFLPGHGFRWLPPCGRAIGLKPALEQGDYLSALCLMAGKAYYYLGTYSPHMFVDPQYGHNTQGLFVDASRTRLDNMRQLADGSYQKIDVRQNGSISESVRFSETSKYFLSLSARSDFDHQVVAFSLKDPQTSDIVYQQFALLGPQDNTLEIATYLHRSGEFEAVLELPHLAANDPQVVQTFGQPVLINQHPIFISDAQIAEARFADIRFRSVALLLLQLAALCGAVLFVVRYRQQLFDSKELSFVLLMVTLCLGQAMLITPEQRFIIAPMAIIWLLCLLWLITIMSCLHHPVAEHRDPPKSC